MTPVPVWQLSTIWVLAARPSTTTHQFHTNQSTSPIIIWPLLSPNLPTTQPPDNHHPAPCWLLQSHPSLQHNIRLQNHIIGISLHHSWVPSASNDWGPRPATFPASSACRRAMLSSSSGPSVVSSPSPCRRPPSALSVRPAASPAPVSLAELSVCPCTPPQPESLIV